jgi:hypothetical protein
LALFHAVLHGDFSPLLVASFLPRKSLFVRGCAAGRDAARQDVAKVADWRPRPTSNPAPTPQLTTI